MEYRKITESKGSFVIRLPVAWAAKRNLKAGDYIKVVENTEFNLVISPAD